MSGKNMMTHDELVKKMLSNPAVKAGYDSLEEEFTLLDELLKARKKLGLRKLRLLNAWERKQPRLLGLKKLLYLELKALRIQHLRNTRQRLVKNFRYVWCKSPPKALFTYLYYIFSVK
ncbi:hypothetical protein SODG_005780 [Sodalis praecaptivus]